MPYLANSDLTKALTDSGVTIPTPTDEQLTSAVHNAGCRIDMSVTAGKFTLPLATPYFSKLVQVATAIALWNLLFELRKSTPTVKSNYEAALKWLDGVALGNTSPITG